MLVETKKGRERLLSWFVRSLSGKAKAKAKASKQEEKRLRGLVRLLESTLVSETRLQQSAAREATL